MIFFFFSSRRRHTRSLCDWSSDVCSSDLVATPPVLRPYVTAVGTGLGGEWRGDLDQPTTLSCGLIRHEQLCSAPSHSKDCAVQSSLGLDVPARAGRSAT